jgi:hypothetical protein
MSFYNDMATTANELLSEFGQSVTLTRKSTGSYDPATSTSIITETTQTGKAAIFPRGIKDIDGTLIKQGDYQMLLSPKNITIPIVGDTVTINSIIYTITMIHETAPANTSVLIDCNIRR